MLVITFVTDPSKGQLDGTKLTALQRHWDGEALTWMSDGEAAEFTVSNLPPDFWDTWQVCQSIGIDILPIQALNRRKKLLLADMDSTLIHQECVDELAAEAGFGPKVAAITARAMNGEIEFESAMAERVALLKDLPLDVITNVLETRITYMAGGKTLVSTMKANGAYAALVSGGFTDFTGPVAAHLGFDEHRSNILLQDGERLTGEVQHPILGRQSKVEALNEITAARGWSVEDAVAVGDGANDLGMLGLAGMGVALHAKPAVAAQCDLRVNHGNLTALLFAQGFRRDEFA